MAVNPCPDNVNVMANVMANDNVFAPDNAFNPVWNRAPTPKPARKMVWNGQGSTVPVPTYKALDLVGFKLVPIDFAALWRSIGYEISGPIPNGYVIPKHKRAGFLSTLVKLGLPTNSSLISFR